MLTQQTLREMLYYAPETGIFTWRNPPKQMGPKRHPGQQTGTLMHGYIMISIQGERFAAHRLAWLYMTGKWPDHDIDHVNLQRGDNRWDNLREATVAQNAHNRPLQSSNKSGCRGVWFQNGKWLARVTVNKKIHYLGSFLTYEDAVAAREASALRLHGEFARLDSPLNNLAI